MNGDIGAPEGAGRDPAAAGSGHLSREERPGWARAKLNLGLRVAGRREDGLHSLRSLVVFPEIGDELRLAAAGEESGCGEEAVSLDILPPRDARIESGFDGARGDAPHLIVKAAQELRRRLGEPEGCRARMALTRRLPLGAGLGAGSAGAAAAMRLLARHWRAGLSAEELGAVGWPLGADIPVCLFGEPAWVAGAGEKVEAVEAMPEFRVALVFPARPVATADAFAWLARSGRCGEAAARPAGGFDSLEDLLRWLEGQGNDFDSVVLERLPECARARSLLAEAGALHCGMSGSGSTQFGIFESGAGGAEEACRAIAERHPAWWTAAARVAPLGRGEGAPRTYSDRRTTKRVKSDSAASRRDSPASASALRDSAA